ncbi:MAG: hypothetical protein ACREEM_36795 [Blastocatellia bacterium]
MLDVGADITAIPQRLVRELSLVKFSEIGVSGFRVEAELIDTFLIGLQLHNWEMEAVNQFVLTLDGPNLTFTIQKPGDDAEQSG